MPLDTGDHKILEEQLEGIRKEIRGLGESITSLAEAVLVPRCPVCTSPCKQEPHREGRPWFCPTYVGPLDAIVRNFRAGQKREKAQEKEKENGE